MAHPAGYTSAAALLVAASAACCTSSGATAQDNGGLNARFTFSEKLLWDDGEEKARSDLGFTLSSKTRTQNLSLTLSGGIEKSFSDGLEGDLQDPHAALVYGLQSKGAALDLNMNFRRSEISSLAFDEDPDTTGSFVLDNGDREDRSTRLRFEVGRDAPFGAVLSTGYSTTEYFNTTSTSVVDSENYTGSLNLRFEINPAITGRAELTLSDLDRDGGTDVRRETLSAGAAIAVSPALEAQIDVGHTRVVQTGITPRTVEEGLFYALALSHDRPNGSLTGSLDSDLDENGRRTTIRLNRHLDLPAGSLGFGFGLSRHGGSSSLNPIYSMSYVQDLPRGQFDASIDQNFTTNAVGDETLDSRLRVGLRLDLTPRDQIKARMTFRETDPQNGGGSTQQLDIGFDYSRNLNKDWSLTSGFTHSRRENASGSETKDDTLFVGLRTAVEWRP